MPVAARIAGEGYNRKIVWQLGNRYGRSYDTQLKIEQFIAAHQAEILAWSGQAGTAVGMGLQSVIWVVLIPILAIFFLRGRRQFSATLLHTFGEVNQRRLLRLIMTNLDVMLARFIRAQPMLAGISLVLYSAVLSALRFPYALVLGFAARAMEFIPRYWSAGCRAGDLDLRHRCRILCGRAWFCSGSERLAGSA